MVCPMPNHIYPLKKTPDELCDPDELNGLALLYIGMKEKGLSAYYTWYNTTQSAKESCTLKSVRQRVGALKMPGNAVDCTRERVDHFCCTQKNDTPGKVHSVLASSFCLGGQAKQIICPRGGVVKQSILSRGVKAQIFLSWHPTPPHPEDFFWNSPKCRVVLLPGPKGTYSNIIFDRQNLSFYI